jgi:hypothetical protein
VNPKLFGQFKNCMNDIELWLFGHDHSFFVGESYTYDDATLKAPRLIGNGACQYREASLSHYETITPGTFGVSGEEVPRPVIKNVFPNSFDNLLNNSFVLMNIGSDSIRVSYYEIPQIALGCFGDPKVFYYEDITL